MLRSSIYVWVMKYGTMKIDSVDEVVSEYRLMHNYNNEFEFDGIEYRDHELFIHNENNDKDDSTIKNELIEQINKINENLK